MLVLSISAVFLVEVKGLFVEALTMLCKMARELSGRGLQLDGNELHWNSSNGPRSSVQFLTGHASLWLFRGRYKSSLSHAATRRVVIDSNPGDE